VPWLTFLSDYGHEDAFLGVCKGVIARTAPQVQILDLLHLVNPQDVEQGAAVLASAIPYLPAPAVHLALVDPFRAARVALRVEASDAAVATSGTAERGAHVFDPHTGERATELVSLTVVGPDLAVADAYATAGVAMGQRARDWLTSLPDHRAIAITAGGDVWTT